MCSTPWPLFPPVLPPVTSCLTVWHKKDQEKWLYSHILGRVQRLICKTAGCGRWVSTSKAKAPSHVIALHQIKLHDIPAYCFKWLLPKDAVSCHERVLSPNWISGAWWDIVVSGFRLHPANKQFNNIIETTQRGRQLSKTQQEGFPDPVTCIFF